MIGYIIAVSFSLMIGNYASSSKKNNYCVFLFLCIFWWLLLSLQYDVGTDYFSYKHIFSSLSEVSLYYKKQEFLFAFIATFVAKNGLPAQLGFFLMYACLFLGLFMFLKKSVLKNVFVYFYVMICCSSYLYNATNGLRQYTAIPFISLSCLCFLNKQWLQGMAFTVVGYFFHASAILTLPAILLFVLFANKIHSRKFYLLILLMSVFFLFWNPISVFEPLIALTRYAHYLQSDFMKQDRSIVNSLTKIVWLPVYVWSLYINVGERVRRILRFGFLAQCMKLALVKMVVFSRIALNLELLSIFPLYYVFAYALAKKKKDTQIFVMLMYLVFGIGMMLLRFFIAWRSGLHEYSYKSVFSNFS